MWLYRASKAWRTLEICSAPLLIGVLVTLVVVALTTGLPGHSGRPGGPQG